MTSPDLQDAPEEQSRTPSVTLDTEEISQEMAARLTMALLSQVLYMKGQIPFPVASLMKMADRRASDVAPRGESKASKKKNDFLESYDDLSAHLQTAFVALSTALAHNEKLHRRSDTEASSRAVVSSTLLRLPAKVHLFLVIGPSPSSSKARFLLELDGFRVEKFGESHYLSQKAIEDSVDSDADTDEGSETGSESESDEYEEEIQEQDISSRPCTSQRPTTLDASSCLATPESHCTSGSSVLSSPPASVSSGDSDSDSDIDDLEDSETQRVLQDNVLAEAQQAEEASLKAGERLLSRALFTGGDGIGFGDEIAPTQTHILLRAPRRFFHPTWVPRQNLGSTLDRHLKTFLDSDSTSNKKTAKGRARGAFGAGVQTMGIKVKSRCSAREGTEYIIESEEEDEDEGGEDEDEDNEMIWWSWDGKLVGFSD
ncbi:hypothetical protein M422DRAFT_248761 [Sphaerobolus stellatus SS14]|nr:hypothetical protein M422DRAFT_248761 [Sphaerobolus stellatus SS14]